MLLYFLITVMLGACSSHRIGRKVSIVEFDLEKKTFSKYLLCAEHCAGCWRDKSITHCSYGAYNIVKL